MNKEWNRLVLQSLFNNPNTSPLIRYFIWDMLREYDK